jgi:hypothetical protein
VDRRKNNQNLEGELGNWLGIIMTFAPFCCRDLRVVLRYGIVAALIGGLVMVPRHVRAAADDTNGMALLSAVINLQGELVRGSGVASFNRQAAGFYSIMFDRSIDQCAFGASMPDLGFAVVQAALKDLQTGRIGLVVNTRQSDGTTSDDIGVSVVVFCHR